MIYFRLHANCIITKGAFRAVILDFHLNRYIYIPLELADKLNGELIYSKSTKNTVLNKFIDFLVENDFGFLTENQESFGKLALEFNRSSKITNAIIELDKLDRTILKSLEQLDQLSCESIEIRISCKDYTWKELCFLFSTVKSTSISSVYLYIQHNASIPNSKWVDLVKMNSRIAVLYLYGTNREKKSPLTKKIVYLKEENLSKKKCGKINSFAINIASYTESIHHNSCLNCKISIDVEGNIKNCPSMKESYGNVQDTTLKEAIEKPGFKKLWNINKDKILVCKDCEFRYICTDCRAYVDDPEDILSKPLKCGYNPYIGEWSEWSTNPLKQKAIDFYDLRGVIKL